MKKEQILPTILIIIDLLSSAGYISVGDWRRAIYWIAAAVLTFTVTF